MAFNALAEYATGGYPLDVVLADVNGDTRPDMLVANATSSTVDVRLGNGGGAFAAAASYSLPRTPNSVVIGDFDNDGVTDLVVAVSDSAKASLDVLKGNGDGSFQSPAEFLIPPQLLSGSSFTLMRSQFLKSVATGDLNRDGKLDLVVTGATQFWHCPYGCYFYGEAYVNVLIGNGSGGFATPQVYPLGHEAGPVAIEDLNSDGAPDVITAEGGHLSVLPGDGNGALGSPIQSGSGSRLSSLMLEDIDGDGLLDTVLADVGLRVQKGQANGTFIPSTWVYMGLYPLDSAVMGDVNGDGKLDLIAVASPHTCTDAGYYCYAGYTTKQAAVVLGNGQGAFSLPITSSLGVVNVLPDSVSITDLALADLTGDGLPELVTLESYGLEASIASNDGNWNPPPAIFISDVTVTEGDTGTVSAVFTVSLSGAHDSVSVDYATADGDAVAGDDYGARSGTLTFAPSEYSKTITVSVIGDLRDEFDEEFFMNLSHAAGGVITDAEGRGTIRDNDPAPLVTINNVSKYEGNTGTTSFVFTVSLSSVSGRWVTVNFATANGTATVANNDYYSATGKVSIAPGQTTATIVISARGDRQKEANEIFYLNLTVTDGGTISDSQGLGTILNDDGGGPAKLASSNLAAAFLTEDELNTNRRRK